MAFLSARRRPAGAPSPGSVLFELFSPLKSTAGFPGSSVEFPEPVHFLLKLFCQAHASIKVPSTVKCSSDRSLSARACTSTRSKRARAMSPSSSRSRSKRDKQDAESRHSSSYRRAVIVVSDRGRAALFVSDVSISIVAVLDSASIFSSSDTIR